MMGANAEPENRQFSVEKLHDTKKIFVAVIYFCGSLSQVDGYCSSLFSFTQAVTFPI